MLDPFTLSKVYFGGRIQKVKLMTSFPFLLLLALAAHSHTQTQGVTEFKRYILQVDFWHQEKEENTYLCINPLYFQDAGFPTYSVQN